MRNVLKSRHEVAHFWANQVQESGKAGNMYFENGRIYSYGSHFCIARILPSGTVVFTTRDYSPSTGQHKSIARSAAYHRPFVYCHNPAGYARENIERTRVEICAAMNASEKPRIRQKTRDAHKAHALYLAQQANEYIAALPEHERQGIEPLPLDLSDVEALRQHLRDVAAEEERQALVARQKQEERERERLSQWRTGDLVQIHGFWQLPVALRMRGDRIETSHGADIPVADALRLWPIVQRCRAANFEYHAAPHGGLLPLRPTDDRRVGHYQLSMIRADGSIVVGCHDIPYAEIAGIAAQLGLMEPETQSA